MLEAFESPQLERDGFAKPLAALGRHGLTTTLGSGRSWHGIFGRPLLLEPLAVLLRDIIHDVILYHIIFYLKCYIK